MLICGADVKTVSLDVVWNQRARRVTYGVEAVENEQSEVSGTMGRHRRYQL